MYGEFELVDLKNINSVQEDDTAVECDTTRRQYGDNTAGKTDTAAETVQRTNEILTAMGNTTVGAIRWKAIQRRDDMKSERHGGVMYRKVS